MSGKPKNVIMPLGVQAGSLVPAGYALQTIALELMGYSFEEVLSDQVTATTESRQERIAMAILIVSNQLESMNRIGGLCAAAKKHKLTVPSGWVDEVGEGE
jgi:hypothetical protein